MGTVQVCESSITDAKSEIETRYAKTKEIGLGSLMTMEAGVERRSGRRWCARGEDGGKARKEGQ